MKWKKILSALIVIGLILATIPALRTSASTSQNLWKESFENGISDWITFNKNGDTNNWGCFDANDSMYSAFKGNGLMASNSAGVKPDNYAISPLIKVDQYTDSAYDTIRVSWYASAFSSVSFNECYYVSIYVDNGEKIKISDVDNISSEHTFSFESGGVYSLFYFDVDICDYLGKNIRLVFHHKNSSEDSYALQIDEISVDMFCNSFATLADFTFEDDAEGWSFIDVDGDGRSWKISSSMAYEGKKCLFSYSKITSELNPQNYAVSPAINISDNGHLQLDWYARASSKSAYKEHYAVYVYIDNDVPTAESISKLTPVFEETLDTYEYTKKSVDLDAYTGYNSIRIIFYHYIPEGGSAQSRLLIDNVTVTGVAKPSHSAAFLVDGATYGPVNSYAEGEQIVAPADPSKTGYTFTGWDPAVGTMGNADMTFNAKFEAKTYNVKFMNGEVQHDANTVKYDGAYTLPAAPTKDGYTFAGWVDAEGNAMPATHTTDGDVTFYAKWVTSAFDAKFYLDAAKTDLYDTKSVEFGAAITAPAAPSKTGYTFKGWSLDGSTVLADLGTMDTEGKDFIAVFEANTYKITYYVDNVIVKVDKYKYGDMVTAYKYDLPDGTSFAGWITEIPETMPAKDVNIYGTTLEKYGTVIFNVNGIEYMRLFFDYGAKVTAPEYKIPEGYTFSGWELPETMPAEDITLNAILTANTYTIKFTNTGDSTVKDITGVYGASITAPADPVRTGYTFAGWYVAGTDTAYTIPATMPDITTEDKTLVLEARWTANSYTIIFKDADGTVYKQIDQDYDTDITAPDDPTKTGYTFAGWDTEVPAKMPVTPDGGLIITAKWTVNKYTMSFNSDGGTAVESKTYDFGAKTEAPAAPTKTGYTFAGWYLGDEAYIFGTMPANDVALVAHWTINEYTMSFNSDGGSAVESRIYAYGAQTEAPAAPTKEGYTFAGWYLGDEAYTFGTMPANNVELTAHWNVNTYKIVFVDSADTSKVYDTIELAYGTSIVAPKNPTKVGYTFAGWDADIPETMPVTPADGLVIKALFRMNPQISIKGFTENKYVDYRTTITFKAVVADKPAVGEIRWYINGVYSGSGEKYTMTEVKANFTVQAKFETSKEILSMTEIETVNVNTGFFAKLVAFFKGLFGKLPSGTQGEDI